MCGQYKTKTCKRIFQGNKIVLKNNPEKEDCLDEEAVLPEVPIFKNNVDTIAGRKLVYQEEEKRR